MKAITVLQPWASLIALGEKRFETRSWQTGHRGPLAIHAGKNVDWAAEAFFDNWAYLRDTFKRHDIRGWRQLPFGAVIAVVDLVDVIPVRWALIQADERERGFGDFSHGRYAWDLLNAQQVGPFLERGRQSLWEWQVPKLSELDKNHAALDNR